MDSMNARPEGHEAHRDQANRAELVERIARTIRKDGRIEALDGLYFEIVK
jgi:hypothetical protein